MSGALVTSLIETLSGHLLVPFYTSLQFGKS